MENSASIMAVWAKPEDNGFIFEVRPRLLIDTLNGSPPPRIPWRMIGIFLGALTIASGVESNKLYSTSGLIVMGIVAVLIIGASLVWSAVRRQQERDAEERGR